MLSNIRIGFFASLLTACTVEQASVRHKTEKVSDTAAVPTTAPISFNLTQADLRPLSKVEIQNSLQDIFLLPAPPELENFVEQSSKSQIFRNSYGILNDSSSLDGLSRDITALIKSLDLDWLSGSLMQCTMLDSADCRRRFLERIATHAWRRPLQSEELALLEKQSTEISKLAPTVQGEALSHILGQIIFDPRFLFRFELGAGDPSTAAPYALAGWEKLAAISYNLTHRPPSLEQIRSLADFENNPARFNKLIDDIMDSSAMAVALSSMISQWLMYYDLENMDIQGDPNWSKAKAREQMAAAHHFVAESLSQEGTLQDLFTKPNPENGGFGIFSSKAFLTSTSKNGQGSMILRGVRIIRNALCQGMGVPPGTLEAAPPKDLSTTDPNYNIKLTLMHGARPDCAACHRLIDPAGLALHTFDGFGENMNSLVDFTALGIPSEVKVGLGGHIDSINTGSAKEFAESIAHSPTFARCFSRNALRYVLGRDLTAGETATADQLADKYLKPEANAKDSLANFFRDIMTSDTVYMRVR
jgi:hypothetical protein